MSIVKDPNEHLDYAIDLTAELAAGEVISSAAWVTPTGISAGLTGNSSTRAWVWLSGGTPGESYRVEGTVTTNQTRVFVRSILIDCLDR